MVENQHFFAGVLARNPHFLRGGGRLAHTPGPVNFFCLEPFLQHQPTTSNSCCEEKPVVHKCSGPQFSWWILSFRGSWVFFALITIH